MAAKEAVESEIKQLWGSHAEKREDHEKVSDAQVEEVAQLEKKGDVFICQIG